MSAAVAGPSAGTLDVWRRLINIASIAVPIVVVLVLAALRVSGGVLAVIAAGLFVGLFVASLVVGSRVTRAMRRELEAGYSTLYDVADYELRDARTLEVLRSAHVAPAEPGRRSLIAGMFGVKPGTVLAKRIRDEERDERDPR